MQMREIIERANHLLARHRYITPLDLERFCGGAITEEEAEKILFGIAQQVGPKQFSAPPPNRINMIPQGLYNHIVGAPAQQGQIHNLAQGFLGTTTAVPSAPKKPKKTTKPKAPFKKGDRIELLTDDYAPTVPSGSLGTVVFTYVDYCDIAIDGIEDGTLAVYHKFLKKYVKQKVTIDSVVLAEEKKEEIRASISQNENATLIFEKWGFSQVFEKGTAISLLFYGIPGTGKTLMAQAIADEADAQLKVYSTADIESSEPGGAERMIRTIFKEASKQNKAGKKRVLLFDECDSLLMDRNELGAILGAQVNALLTEIEHYDGTIIFTTNRLGKLDTALERRLSAKIEFPFPDQIQRLAIWKRMIPKQAPLATDVDFETLAKHPVAGGNIKNAVLNAARYAAYKKQSQICMKDLEEAIKRESKSQEAFLTAYNKTPHHQMHGFSKNRGGLAIDKEVTKAPVETINITKTLSLEKKDDD